MYNVTLITPFDEEVLTTETLHKFELPYTIEETGLTKEYERAQNHYLTDTDREAAQRKVLEKFLAIQKLHLRLFYKDFEVL